MKRSESLFYTIRKCFAGMGWYLFPLSVFWISLMLLLLLYGEDGSFNLINSFTASGNSKLLDCLIIISEGIVISALFVLAAARTWPVETILGSIVVFIAWYTCIILKYNAFSGWQSPESIFGAKHIRLIRSPLQPELDFPSAHATVIAALCTFVAWFYRYSPGSKLLIFMAGTFLTMLHVLAGWSFISDILAGSILGTISTCCCILWLHKRIEQWYDRRSEWWQGIIVAILRTSAICVLLVNLKYFVA